MTHPEPGRLTTVPLFAGLSEATLTDLAARFEVEHYEPGESPVRTDRHGYAFFILSEGRARAEVDGQVLEELEPGAVFGEMAFFAPDSRRSANVVATTPITVLSMFGSQFRVMQKDLPEVAKRLEDLVAERRARVDAVGGET